jgi:putative ABC transport system permease protein
MAQLLEDVHRGWRHFVKSPVFSLVTVLTLAIGIGVNCAIFTIINGVLLRPLPFKDPDQLVMVWRTSESEDPRGKLSEPELIDLGGQGRVFAEIAAFSSIRTNLTGRGEPEQLQAAAVTAKFWPILGVKPVVGRFFSGDESNSVVISHGFWQRRFGSDPAAVGQKLVLNEEPHTIVGVMPADFRFPEKVELWASMELDPAAPSPRGAHYLNGIARLRPGVSAEQAQAQMKIVANGLQEEYPAFYPGGTGFGLVVVTLAEDLVKEIRRPLLILLVGGGLVLLIACANVANLHLNRALRRRRAITMHSVLGASHGRILCQLLSESLFATLAAGALGLLFATWGIKLLLSRVPEDLPRFSDAHVDPVVFAFTLLVCTLVGLVVGLVPAMQLKRLDPSEDLKAGGSKMTESAGSHRLRNTFVIGEVALALLVLVGAGLLVKSLSELQAINPGFNPKNVLSVSIALPSSRYRDDLSRAVFFQRLLELNKTLPGVRSAGAISHLPLSGRKYSGDFTIEGMARDPRDSSFEALRAGVAGDYFGTMGITALKGRLFDARDHGSSPGVVIIDDALAKRFWPAGNPLGKRLKFGTPDSKDPWLTIVGVVGSIRHKSLDAEPMIQMYFPHTQFAMREMFVVLRSSLPDSTALVPAFRQQVLQIDKDQPVSTVRTMEEWQRATLAKQYFSTLLLVVFAIVAVILTAVGIYSVLSSEISERAQEIGIRMALGAQRSNVFSLVLRHSMLLTLIGLLLGIGFAFFSMPVLKSQLYGVSPLDARTFLTSSIFIAIVALLASYIPVRRATHLDPLATLRRQ